MGLFYNSPNHRVCTTPNRSAVQTDNAAYQKLKVVAVIFFSFTNKCYIPAIPFPNHLFSPEFTVLLQKVSN